MESLICDPFFITEVGTVEAYTSTTFRIDYEGRTGLGEDDSAELKRTSKNSGGAGEMTKEARTKYFDKIYEAEVWSFPDWDSNGGLGVKSGFGSTLHQTEDIRPYLDVVVPQLIIKGIIDVPCGDMNWIPHVQAMGSDNMCYFGGDVSRIAIDENSAKFGEHSGKMR